MAASIGEQLRLAREARGIGLREICEQTRISVHYLEAIEANDYKRLPGGVFNRSFIKAYAKCIGYDEREAIEGYTRYLREHGGESSDEVSSHPLQSKVYTDTPATRSPVLTVVLAVLILAILTAAALAALYWFQRRAENRSLFAPNEQDVYSFRIQRSSLFAPKEQDVYSWRIQRSSLFAPKKQDVYSFRTQRPSLFAPNEQDVYSWRIETTFRSVRSEMSPFALKQTHTPMYNGLTSATTDSGAHDHSRYY